MLRFTQEPSSGSHNQCLAKITSLVPRYVPVQELSVLVFKNLGIFFYFGKQMNKETKLRIHNITAKVALKFGSEDWVLNKREEQRLETAQM